MEALEPTIYCVNPAGAFEASQERLNGALAQAFGATREGIDRICLPESFRPIFGTALNHLRNRGLNPTTDVVWALNPSVQEIGNRVLVPHTHNDRNINPDAVDVRDAAGDKDRTPGWMSSIGQRHEMPRTVVLQPGQQFDLARWGNQRVFVKRCTESSGVTEFPNVVGPISGQAVVDAVAQLHARNEPVQVQAAVPETGEGWDGSAQFFASDGKDGGVLRLLGITRQLVDARNHHFGNEAPVKINRRIRRALLKVARTLVNQGLRGAFGIDFRVSGDGENGWITEFNLRVNGSTFPLLIMLLLGKSNMSCVREIEVHSSLSLEDALAIVEDADGVAYHFGFWQAQHRLGVVMFDDDAAVRLEELRDRLTLGV